jgi:hypothetical protein
LRAITPKDGLHVDVIQALKSLFPEMKPADDDAIAALVKARSGN